MITLHPVKPEEKEILWNYLQKYLYELSGIYGLELDENGNFPYPYFEPYFSDEKRRAFFYPVQNVHTAAGLYIAIRVVFNIHGDVVQKSFFDKLAEHFGIGSVGVQLYGKAQVFDLPDPLRKLGIQGRFATGDTNAGELSNAAFQKRQ